MKKSKFIICYILPDALNSAVRTLLLSSFFNVNSTFLFSSLLIYHYFFNCCGKIISAGEMMSVAQPFLEDQMHPTVIIGAYRQAMDDMLEILRDQISVPVDVDNREEMLKIVRSSVGTKFVHKW